MSQDAFIGQIQPFPYTFPPRSWADCNGQELPIAQNTALFSLIGTIYGGDGRTWMGLPNLQGRTPIHYGDGPGLTNIPIGATGGVETVTLNATDMPSHDHPTVSGSYGVSNANGQEDSPAGHVHAAHAEVNNYSTSSDGQSAASTSASSSAGGSFAHNNMMPFLTIRWCICTSGVYPSRS